ncbi:MAG: HAMP domain-containing sensor histidine kinase [Bacteroidota bacterium]
MGVRLRITLLFAFIVFMILSVVCGSVYFFSYETRIHNITTRLANRAITTARLLSYSESFGRNLIQKIDSSTALALSNKTIQAYDSKDNCIYAFSDMPGDTLLVSPAVLDNVRTKKRLYFTAGQKDVVVCHVNYNGFRVVMVIGAIDNEGKENLHQLRLIIFFSFIGGLLIAVAGGYFFSGGLLRPIRKIADEVNEISARNLTSRINPGKINDEWNYLSSTLNSLLNRLQDSFEVQQRFVAHASHELSTPLTSISSQLEVSLQKERQADDYRRVMQSIYQDVRQLNKLTQTLLEFASASGNAAGIVIDIIRIDEILLRLPAELLKIDSRYSVALIFNDLPQEEDRLLVWGNQELLFSAFNNIVSNACKYSPDYRATVTLTVKKTDITIAIADKGPGIPAAELENIFQPFYRIDVDRGIKGFGLGLSLANRIIKLHKGFIEIHSVVGEGTVFSVMLPTAYSSTREVRSS